MVKTRDSLTIKPEEIFREHFVWCGVEWCGVVWCGVVWCGVVCITTFGAT